VHRPTMAPLLSASAKSRLFWASALLCPIAAGFSLLSAYFYVWLNAAGSWPADRSSLWSGAAFAFFCLFGVASVVAIRLLLRHYNSLPRLPDQDEVKHP
jgi:hypothetical protein